MNSFVKKILSVYALSFFTGTLAMEHAHFKGNKKRKNESSNFGKIFERTIPLKDLQKIVIAYAYLNTWTLKNNLQLNSPINALSYIPGSNLIAAGLGNGAVEIWDEHHNKQISVLGTPDPEFTRDITSIIVPNQDTLIAANFDNKLSYWKLNKEGQKVGEPHIYACPKPIEVLTYNEATGALGLCDESHVYINDNIDPAKLNPSRIFSHELVNSLAFSPDGTYIVTGGSASPIHIWNAKEGTYVSTINDLTGNTTGLTWLPDGKTLISCHESGNVKKTDLSNPYQPSASQFLEDRNVTAQTVQVYAPITHHLIVGNNNNTIQIWHPETRAVLDTLDAHTEDVTALAVSHDGEFFASGSKDESLKIWQNVGRYLLRQLDGNLESNNSLITKKPKIA